ncbi:MAG: hypothetical protein F7B61_05410 [Caldisphaeraceae archaeon]|nr:hypothetical protein [Caldisphaeraceae archaeon]
MQILSTGNEEIDQRLAGGIPHPSFIVVEGSHGSGKTGISLLLTQAYLQANLRATYFTSEGDSYSFVLKAIQSGFNIMDYYINGRLYVYSMSVGMAINKNLANIMLKKITDILVKNIVGTEAVIIDSISYLTEASADYIRLAVESFRRISDEGKSIIITFHPNSLPQEVDLMMKNSADGYIKLSETSIAGRRLKVMTIIKLKGLQSGAQTNITFDVDPAFGIKVIPIVVS